MHRRIHKSIAPASCIGTAVFCLALLIGCASSAAAGEIAVLNNGFSIRHDHHVVMGETTRLFLSVDNSSFTDVATADISGFEKDLTPPAANAASDAAMASTLEKRQAWNTASNSKVDLSKVVDSASAAYHLDPDLVNSVIHAESGFNAHAISPKGARGLMQLMPSTASQLGVKNAFDSEDNVGGGSRYLRELLERYDFDLVKALAAYNAGPQRVDHYNGVPPFYETRAYVARIVRDYNRKKIAQEKAALAQKKQASAAGRAVHSGAKQKSASAKRPPGAAQPSKRSANSAAPAAGDGAFASAR